MWTAAVVVGLVTEDHVALLIQSDDCRHDRIVRVAGHSGRSAAHIFDAEGFGGAEVFTKLGEVYAIYLPRASSTGELNLETFTGRFELQWFDPRTGSYVGAPIDLGTGGGGRARGPPPHSENEDWVALVRRQAPLWSGTEAAAVTVDLAKEGAEEEAEEPPKPIAFRAAHPFVYLIRDRKTGAILFMGRVTDPS